MRADEADDGRTDGRTDGGDCYWRWDRDMHHEPASHTQRMASFAPLVYQVDFDKLVQVESIALPSPFSPLFIWTPFLCVFHCHASHILSHQIWLMYSGTSLLSIEKSYLDEGQDFNEAVTEACETLKDGGVCLDSLWVRTFFITYIYRNWDGQT